MTDEKVKVVAAVWETEFIKFLAALAILHNRTILNNRMNSSFSSNHPNAINPILQIIQVQNSWSTVYCLYSISNLISDHYTYTKYLFSNAMLINFNSIGCRTRCQGCCETCQVGEMQEGVAPGGLPG